MKRLWTWMGDRLLQKIEKGHLRVRFPDGKETHYGEMDKPEIMLDIYHHRFFKRMLMYGDIGFAESYMDGDFETDNLMGLIMLALDNSAHLGVKSDDEGKSKSLNLFPYFNQVYHWMRKNSKTQAKKNIAKHYDLSNDFYTLMLDETMMYSAAIFEDKDEPLSEAQKRKITHLADKLHLKSGDKVLEIGSGWGSMAMHLAQEKGCHVTTVTLSEAQKKLCEVRFKDASIEEKIDILLKDYRDLDGQFDAIIAVEMFEAVGKEYFDLFFKKCESLLKPSGTLVMQIITMPDNRYEEYAKGTDFIQKYIFPGGHLPSVAKILETTSKHTRLNLCHLEEYGEDYAKTLNIWHANFEKRKDQVKDLGFDEYFIRMWKMYLNYCEAAFLTRNINLVQVAFSRDGNTERNRGLVL